MGKFDWEDFWGTLLAYSFVIIMVLVIVFLCWRAFVLNYQFDNVCMIKYGENYTASSFEGTSYCAEIDYANLKLSNARPIPKQEEIDKICNIPKFLSFKGGNICNG